jgi:aspartyl-tRNA(Asn)/glutamyl-tRNA(Gln) amidotransferase subunit A
MLIHKKEVSPIEIIETLLSRISALEPNLNSFITLQSDHAIEAARKAEEEIQTGRYRGPLHGITVAFKDLFSVKGVRNSSGSKIFDNHIADPSFKLAAYPLICAPALRWLIE